MAQSINQDMVIAAAGVLVIDVRTPKIMDTIRSLIHS
jgi:hypothetical protein